MSSRTPLPYSPKVLELFKNPINLGEMEDASVIGRAGSPLCGDMIKLYLKIEDGLIKKATFESYGCASNIATASVLTTMLENITLEEAWNIKMEELDEKLGGLPKVKHHCGTLAVGSLHRAIRKYHKDNNMEFPVWLPIDFTKDEKHAMEEEELAKQLAKKYGLI